MDTHDAKLLAERSRLVTLLSGLANALGELPPERLAEVLPMLTAPCTELELAACRARILGGGPLGGASISGASILP